MCVGGGICAYKTLFFKIDLLTSLVGVEILWPHVVTKHYIIVQIDEVIGQPGDAMEVTLNCRRAICGEVRLVHKDLL